MDRKLANLLKFSMLCLTLRVVGGLTLDWEDSWTLDVAQDTPFEAGSGIYYIPRRNASWKEAEIFCVRRMSHLVDVRDTYEATELSILMKLLQLPVVWTGAYVGVNNTGIGGTDTECPELRKPPPGEAGRTERGRPEPSLPGPGRPVYPGGHPEPTLPGPGRSAYPGGRPEPSLPGPERPAYPGGRPEPSLPGPGRPPFPGGRPEPLLPGPERCGGLVMVPAGRNRIRSKYVEVSCYCRLTVFCLAPKVNYGQGMGMDGKTRVMICPPGFSECSRSTCFRMESMNNWFMARQLCKGSQASLIDIYSEDDLQVTLGDPEMVQCLGKAHGAMWTGYSDVDWMWSNGKDFGFTNWALGFPRPPIGGCVAYRVDGWIDMECDKKLRFVCKKDVNDTGSWDEEDDSADQGPSTPLYIGLGVLVVIVLLIATALIVVLILIKRTKKSGPAIPDHPSGDQEIYENLGHRDSVYENDDPTEKGYNGLTTAIGNDYTDQPGIAQRGNSRNPAPGIYDDKCPGDTVVPMKPSKTRRNSRMRRFLQARPRKGSLPATPHVLPGEKGTGGPDQDYLQIIPSPYSVLPVVEETTQSEDTCPTKGSLSSEISATSDDSGISDGDKNTAALEPGVEGGHVTPDERISGPHSTPGDDEVYDYTML